MCIRDREKTAPTDEELAQEAGDFPDFAALRAHLRSNLEEERGRQAETAYRRAVLESVVANAVTLEFPPQLVEDELERTLDEYKDDYRNMGLDFESYLRYTQQTVEQVREGPVSYKHLRAHETVLNLVCRLLLDKKTDQIPA